MSNAPAPQAVIEAVGITAVTGVEPVVGGMSGAVLWRVRRQLPATDLLLRLFPQGNMAGVEREAANQRHAGAGGIPVPAVSFVGVVASCPVTVMSWVDGRTMLEQLIDTPDRAEHLGERSGRTVARLHALPLPESPRPGGTVDRWYDWVDPWLRDRVTGDPSRRVLVHADFHPLNILTDGDRVASVLDWTNATIAHPLIDLGRTFACLRLGASLFAGLLPADRIDAWWRGLVTGYGETDRTIEELAPFFAFGLVTVVEERLRIASTEIPAAIIDALVVERDAWLDLAARSGA